LKDFIRAISDSLKKKRSQSLSHVESCRQGQPGMQEPKLPRIPHCDALINKSGFRFREDLKILSVANIVDDMIRLKRELAEKNLKFTTWMGNFTSHNEDKEMEKLWEDAWVLAHSDAKAGTRILDAGGASTILSFYLASKGCEVSVIDSDWLDVGLIANAVAVSRAMNWKMDVISGDITHPLPYPAEHFDFVFCICVLEHLTSQQRKKAMKNLAACLKPGGLMGLTVDYDIERGGDKGLRFRDRDKIDNDLILPSGLAVYGNDHPIDEYDERFFLGALILKKGDRPDEN
jgi:SAM-dependent methyltransferase